MWKLYSSAILCIIFVLSCTSEHKELPVLGQKTVVQRTVDGKTVYDSIPHTIPAFELINQDGDTVTGKMMKGKVYIADFFFTSCPTICPRIKANTLPIYEQYKHRDNFRILSFSIDSKYDTVGRLAWYADKLDISTPTWHLLTGKKETIYKLVPNYMAVATEDKNAPGGFDHSGYVALIDRKGRIRGLYDGTIPNREALKKKANFVTNTKTMEDLMEDIAVLLNEKN